jgi:hypothetical protein
MKRRIRKARHIDYVYKTINELHADIFNAALDIVNNDNVNKEQLKVKIQLYKKYNRRLRPQVYYINCDNRPYIYRVIG